MFILYYNSSIYKKKYIFKTNKKIVKQKNQVSKINENDQQKKGRCSDIYC